jgi:hypothetical protein
MNTFTDWFAQQKQRVETAKREKIELRAGPPTYPALDSMPVEMRGRSSIRSSMNSCGSQAHGTMNARERTTMSRATRRALIRS